MDHADRLATAEELQLELTDPGLDDSRTLVASASGPGSGSRGVGIITAAPEQEQTQRRVEGEAHEVSLNRTSTSICCWRPEVRVLLFSFLWSCADPGTPAAPCTEGGQPECQGETPIYPECSAALDTRLQDLLNDMPEAASDAWVALEIDGRAALEDAITAAVSEEVTAAIAAADRADYDLCTDANRLVFSPRDASGRAWAVLDLQGAPLQLEVPHPLYDTDTLSEALHLLDRLRARVLLTSGTHRCAALEPTPCAGVSSVCTGTPEAYPASDPAHATDTSFHALHVAASEAFPEDLVVSVHGMSGDGASLSDGTDATVDADSPVARLATAMTGAFPNEPITTCNPGTEAEVDLRLCGTTNVQGRHLNGSADPCVETADSGSGRFIHLEQSRSIRAAPDRVADALEALLPD